MASEYGELRQQSHDLVQNVTPSDLMPLVCISQERVDKLKRATNLNAIAHTLRSAESDSECHEIVVWIEACLRNPHGLDDEGRAAENGVEISNWVSIAITPPRFFNARSLSDADAPLEPTSEDILRFQLKALAGLRLLLRLSKLVPAVLESAGLDFHACVATFTDAEDPWTHSACPELALQLLDAHVSTLDTTNSTAAVELIPRMLREVVRPRFRKVRNHAITTQGRKAISQPEVRYMDSIPELEEKPWKFKTAWVTTVFEWCVERLEAACVPENWPLLIPPLLAMIDDENTEHRVKGCRSLRCLLSKVDSSLLHRTGLGEVFEQALLPLLSYLPTLTPEPESLRLLGEVYPSLLSLTQVRFTSKADRHKKLRCLDKILHDGILRGCSFAADYPDIITRLMNELQALTQIMQIQAVKHLKTIIPLVTDNLCNPFITSHPPLLLASTHALQTLILECWPRMSRYKGEVLKAVVVCWMRFEEDGVQTQNRTVIDAELKRVLGLLRATLADEKESLADIDRVLESDARLLTLAEHHH